MTEEKKACGCGCDILPKKTSKKTTKDKKDVKKSKQVEDFIALPEGWEMGKISYPFWFICRISQTMTCIHSLIISIFDALK